MRTALAIALSAAALLAQESWTTAHVAPTATLDFRMCWHDADRRVVAVCSRQDRPVLETWERVDGVWQQRRSATEIPLRQSFELVYDAGRRVVVLFGGYDPFGTFTDETWEWDGVDWTRRTPANAPSPRLASMVYDRARGVTLLYGGQDNSGAGNLGDLWQWDGVDWTPQSNPSFNPGGRAGAAAAYDEARDVVVLFGGITTWWQDDVWEYDGATWTRFTPAVRPPALGNPSLAYDRTNGVTLLYGGRVGGVANRDVWAWDGQSWTRRPAAAQNPGERLTAGFVHDDASQRMVLHGGGYTTDTWTYDGASDVWQRDPYVCPRFSSAAMACFDGNRHTVLFTIAETLLWDHDQREFQLAPSGPRPPSSYGASMCFDLVRQEAIWWGAPGPQPRQTWAFDRASLQWQQRAPSTSPPPLYDAAMAFDAANGEVVLFGGEDGLSPTPASVTAQTWVWDGLDWTQRAPATSPPARTRGAMAYDWLTGRVVLFGGFEPNGPLDDVWEWDGVTWTQRAMSGGPAGTPAPRIDSAMGGRFDGLLVAGGYDSQQAFADLWALRGSQWVRLAIDGMPAALPPQTSVDFQRGELVAFGGPTQLAPGAQQLTSTGVWRWGVPAAQAVPIGRGCAGSAGTPTLTVAPLLQPGQVATLTTASVTPGALVAFAFGDAGGRTDLDRDCRAFVLPPYAAFGVAAQAGGVADLALTVPANPLLAGQELWAQSVALDPVVGYALANALRLRIGGP